MSSSANSLLGIYGANIRGMTSSVAGVYGGGLASLGPTAGMTPQNLNGLSGLVQNQDEPSDSWRRFYAQH